jgi:hypothetical protein
LVVSRFTISTIDNFIHHGNRLGQGQGEAAERKIPPEVQTGGLGTINRTEEAMRQGPIITGFEIHVIER